jgi:hypothetical protein
VHMQGLYFAGTGISKLLGAIDKALETTGVLGKLETTTALSTDAEAKVEFRRVSGRTFQVLLTPLLFVAQFIITLPALTMRSLGCLI